MTDQTRVALDAMGGDHGPTEAVAGALEAVAALPYVDVVLVGDRAQLEPLVAQAGANPRISIHHASQVVAMDEAPATAVRSRPDNSMSVAAGLVKAGAADAFVTPGNTGAALAASLFSLGRIKGIRRPALAATIPSLEGRFLILDVGANTECRPYDLLQFGFMGHVYADRVLGIGSPRVGIVSNGEEEGKGNDLVKAAYPLLKASDLRFVGALEGKDIPNGLADVLVTDGFTGNVMVKTAEGIMGLLLGLIRDEAKTSLRGKIGGGLMRPVLRQAVKRLDYNEVGGAPLLGVDGVVVVGHGRSKRTAIASLIRAGAEAARQGVVQAIADGLGALSSVEEDAV